MPPDFDILKEVVFQVLQKVTVEDGDILILRCDPELLSDIAERIQEILPSKRVLLVHEDQVKFLGEVDEHKMNSFGWYRKENDENTS